MMTEASERFDFPNPFKGVKRLRSRQPDVQPFTLEKSKPSGLRSAGLPQLRHGALLHRHAHRRDQWPEVESTLTSTRADRCARCTQPGRPRKTPKPRSSLRDVSMLPWSGSTALPSARPPSLTAKTAMSSPRAEAIHRCPQLRQPGLVPLLRYLGMERRRPIRPAIPRPR